MMNEYRLSELAQVACMWEATARKVGNVHRHADFASTSLSDFLLSAVAIGEPFADDCRRGVGVAIWNAVERTQLFVKQNTNLGICLLLAPLLAATASPSIQAGVKTILEQLTRDDAVSVYRAIRAANPGGLGRADSEDVANEPTVTLLEAMALASERDLIARQYVLGFADLFDLGVPALCQGYVAHGCVEAAIIECQFAWLAAFPDSLIARKCGELTAANVQHHAARVQILPPWNSMGCCDRMAIVSTLGRPPIS
jgi:triphosphoribosyl-dephospho-CoA synthase